MWLKETKNQKHLYKHNRYKPVLFLFLDVQIKTSSRETYMIVYYEGCVGSNKEGVGSEEILYSIIPSPPLSPPIRTTTIT